VIVLIDQPNYERLKMKKLSTNTLHPLGVYARAMRQCGVYCIARHMDRAGLDISLALRALRMAKTR
jgi:hypothetical protein